MMEITGIALATNSLTVNNQAPYRKGRRYLQLLTPESELAVFRSIRGMCLREQCRWTEAAEAFRAAVKFAPGCRSYKSMLATLEQRTHGTQSADTPITPSQPPQPVTKL